MNRFKKICLYSLALFFIVLMALYIFQDKLIFLSTKLDKSYTFAFRQPFEEYFIKTPDGEEINALWFKPSLASKGLVLYFHGNRGNLQRWGAFAGDLTVHGFDVLMIDYRSYGKSTGSPSEEALYADAELVLQWARSRAIFPRLILYGRSLGSAVASHLAMKVQPDLLILETPFDELRGAIWAPIRPLFALFPLQSVFSNKEHLAAIKSKKVIFHGTADRIVPLSSALRLRSLLGNDDEFIIIENGGHRNLRSFAIYQAKLEEVLNAW